MICNYVFSFEQFGKPGVINPDVQRQSIEALLTSNKPPVENCMRPEFIRLAPPLHIAEDEVGLIITYEPRSEKTGLRGF